MGKKKKTNKLSIPEVYLVKREEILLEIELRAPECLKDEASCQSRFGIGLGHFRKVCRGERGGLSLIAVQRIALILRSCGKDPRDCKYLLNPRKPDLHKMFEKFLERPLEESDGEIDASASADVESSKVVDSTLSVILPDTDDRCVINYNSKVHRTAVLVLAVPGQIEPRVTTIPLV